MNVPLCLATLMNLNDRDWDQIHSLHLIVHFIWGFQVAGWGQPTVLISTLLSRIPDQTFWTNSSNHQGHLRKPSGFLLMSMSWPFCYACRTDPGTEGELAVVQTLPWWPTDRKSRAILSSKTTVTRELGLPWVPFMANCVIAHFN